MGRQIDMFKKRIEHINYQEWKENLSDRNNKDRAFDGSTYEAEEDYQRLKSCLDKVRHIMSNPKGQWWTLFELSKLTGSSEAGVSARIRDLRKEKNGGHNIESSRGRGGLWRYRMKR